MAKHIVKCPKCGQYFDTNTVQAVQVGARRYGHATCYQDNTDFVPLVQKPEEDPDYKRIMDYVSKIFGTTANYALVKKEIKKFTEENKFSLSGILKSLIYWFEVKKNPVDKANGHLGIVPFIYQDAYNYYLALFIAQQANADKVLDNEIKEVTIAPPEMRGTKQKLIDFGEWLDDEQ